MKILSSFIRSTDDHKYKTNQIDSFQHKAAAVVSLEVFVAARRPLGDSLVVVHDSANVGAGSARAVAAQISR